MKTLQTNLGELSIKRFSEYMIAANYPNPNPLDHSTSLIAPLLNMSIEDVDNMDLSIYKKYIEDYSKIDVKSFSDLMVQEMINDFEYEGQKYSVLFEDGSVLLKRSEQKFLAKMMATESSDLDVINKIGITNIYIVAAILFRPENTDTSIKFSEETIMSRAIIFQDNMQAKYIYPYLAEVLKKISE